MCIGYLSKLFRLEQFVVLHTNNIYFCIKSCDPGTGLLLYQIRGVRGEDAGGYECQVSSVPKTSFQFHLHVVVPQVSTVQTVHQGRSIFTNKKSAYLHLEYLSLIYCVFLYTAVSPESQFLNFLDPKMNTYYPPIISFFGGLEICYDGVLKYFRLYEESKNCYICLKKIHIKVRDKNNFQGHFENLQVMFLL